MGTSYIDPVEELRAMLDAGQDITEHPHYDAFIEMAAYDRLVCRERTMRCVSELIELYESGGSLPSVSDTPEDPAVIAERLRRFRVELVLLDDDALADQFLAAAKPSDVERYEVEVDIAVHPIRWKMVEVEGQRCGVTGEPLDGPAVELVFGNEDVYRYCPVHYISLDGLAEGMAKLMKQ